MFHALASWAATPAMALETGLRLAEDPVYEEQIFSVALR
jgi:hypothetical protein